MKIKKIHIFYSEESKFFCGLSQRHGIVIEKNVLAIIKKETKIGKMCKNCLRTKRYKVGII